MGKLLASMILLLALVVCMIGVATVATNVEPVSIRHQPASVHSVQDSERGRLCLQQMARYGSVRTLAKGEGTRACPIQSLFV